MSRRCRSNERARSGLEDEKSESEVWAVATPHILSKGCCEAACSESRAEISQSRRQYSRRPLEGEDGVANISHAVSARRARARLRSATNFANSVSAWALSCILKIYDGWIVSTAGTEPNFVTPRDSETFTGRPASASVALAPSATTSFGDRLGQNPA